MKAIVNYMMETEFTDGALLSCSRKTIMRDIKVLRQEYRCPITYDKRDNCYVLEDKTWEFDVPALLNDTQLLALYIGQKLTKDIFPKSISQRVVAAVNEVLRYNSDTTANDELFDSLKILPEATAVIPDELFLTIFDAWQKRQVLRIEYADKNGGYIARDVEPHTLVFHEMRWSIKGFCRLRGQARTFHLARIRSAIMLDERFKPSKAIISSVTMDKFLDYTKIPNVVIRLTAAGRQFARVYALHSKQRFEKQSDGSYLMRVEAVSEERLVPWLLRQQGDAVVLEPQQLVDAAKNAIRHLAEVYQV